MMHAVRGSSEFGGCPEPRSGLTRTPVGADSSNPGRGSRREPGRVHHFRWPFRGHAEISSFEPRSGLTRRRQVRVSRVLAQPLGQLRHPLRQRRELLE